MHEHVVLVGFGLILAGLIRSAFALVSIAIAFATSTATIALIEPVTVALLRARFGIERPRILVAGLNPHAGESGHLGREEIEVIAPAIAEANREGIRAEGPLPADTLFVPERLARADCVLAMYHDQALIPLKTLAFDRGVNVTLGLPFVRTSPDHGTAFDIAGTGTARPDSLIASLRLADALARRRAKAAESNKQ